MSVSDPIPVSGNILIGGGVAGSIAFELIERFNISGGGGDDTLRDGRLADTLDGGAGDDLIVSGLSADQLFGGLDDDRWQGDLSGFAGAVNFTLVGGTVNLANGTSINGFEAVTLRTGRGDDKLTGGALADAFQGGSGADTLDGKAGSDSLSGGAGDDVLKAGGVNGFDSVDGGAAIDLLLVNLATVNSAITMSTDGPVPASGNLLISGGINGSIAFSNVEIFDVTSGGGADVLRGGRLNDTLGGGGGNDTLVGGLAMTRLTGGLGADVLEFGFHLATIPSRVSRMASIASICGPPILSLPTSSSPRPPKARSSRSTAR